MHKVFLRLTLNRIGATLFVSGFVLLITGLISAIAAWSSDGGVFLWILGLSGGQTVLLGLASFVLSAIVFGLAVANERLVKVEAKLDALARRHEPEKQEHVALAEPGAAGDRGNGDGLPGRLDQSDRRGH